MVYILEALGLILVELVKHIEHLPEVLLKLESVHVLLVLEVYLNHVHIDEILGDLVVARVRKIQRGHHKVTAGVAGHQLKYFFAVSSSFFKLRRHLLPCGIATRNSSNFSIIEASR